MTPVHTSSSIPGIERINQRLTRLSNQQGGRLRRLRNFVRIWLFFLSKSQLYPKVAQLAMPVKYHSFKKRRAAIKGRAPLKNFPQLSDKLPAYAGPASGRAKRERLSILPALL